jgi:hypothetical protein
MLGAAKVPHSSFNTHEIIRLFNYLAMVQWYRHDSTAVRKDAMLRVQPEQACRA